MCGSSRWNDLQLADENLEAKRVFCPAIAQSRVRGRFCGLPSARIVRIDGRFEVRQLRKTPMERELELPTK